MDDDSEYFDLLDQVSTRGWTHSMSKYSTSGVEEIFRQGPYTSDFPGMVTRSAHGKNKTEAVRNFLKQLDEEAGGVLVRLSLQPSPERATWKSPTGSPSLRSSCPSLR